VKTEIPDAFLGALPMLKTRLLVNFTLLTYSLTYLFHGAVYSLKS